MDQTTIAVIIGSIATPLAGLAGWFSKQGMDWYLKYKDDKRVDKKLDDEREERDEKKEDDTLRFIIGRQDGELSSLRSEIKEMAKSHRNELHELHLQHNDCEKKHAALQTELKVRMEYIDGRVSVVEASQKETDRVAEQYRAEQQQKAVEIPPGKFVAELDPDDPDDAKVIERKRSEGT